jgi:hypothetical protein
MNFEQAGDFCRGFAAGWHGFDDLPALFGGDLELAAGNAPFGPRFAQADAGRSRIISRSNSAKEPSIRIIMRPHRCVRALRASRWTLPPSRKNGCVTLVQNTGRGPHQRLTAARRCLILLGRLVHLSEDAFAGKQIA